MKSHIKVPARLYAADDEDVFHPLHVKARYYIESDSEEEKSGTFYLNVNVSEVRVYPDGSLDAIELTRACEGAVHDHIVGLHGYCSFVEVDEYND